MRRRRLLAIAATAVAGCTGANYQASGPRTPPSAPPTDASSAPTADPVESRAQAVIRPLNESYRILRDPLATVEVADVSGAELSTAEAAIADAREAAITFSTAVGDSPAAYRSLPTLVTAHELLFDGLATAVDLHASLSTLDPARVDDPSERLAPLRSATEALASTAAELVELADTEPPVPAAIFLTLDRLRQFAATLDGQSTAVGRLLDVSRNALTGAVDWRTAVAAFEREAFEEARTAFVDARTRYRNAASLLAADLGTEGSFADLADHRSCTVQAALDATETALDATDAALDGDVARATQRLETAQTTRNRCEN